MPRLPKASDFPSSLTLTITPPPDSKPPTNVLILFHGMGDSHVPFARLGEQMKLPETACIAIKGPNALPFADDGFHWCEDVIFDNSMSTLDPDGGFQGTTHLIATEIVQKGLVDACGYQPRDIMLFGMGQGGMLALNIAAANKTQEYSGVVSVGGPLPNEAPASLHPKSKTPVLVAYGADSKWVNSSSEDKIKRVFEHVQLSKYRRPGDTMPKDRDEMLPIMQFFARRLKSTAGVPKGAIPLS